MTALDYRRPAQPAPAEKASLGAGRYLGQFTPGTPDWTASRARRLGGSEIAAVLGLSPWESYFGLWHRKRGTIGPIDDTLLLRMGRRVEPAIADEFAFQHPELLVTTVGAYVHPERDWQLISPDRIAWNRETGDWVPVEIKHPHLTEEWGRPGTDEIPVYYRCQVQQAMDVLEREEHVVVAYFGGDDFREYLIRYDEREAEILRRRGAEFIAHVEAGDPLPEVDGHSATYQAVREMHPDIDGEDKTVPARIAEPFLAARMAVAECEEEARRAAAELAMFLGTARRAIYGVTKAGKPRSIACRMPPRNPDAPPYLKPSPLPKPDKEIA